MERTIWVINTDKHPLEVCIMEIKKWITFESMKPVQLPISVALSYINSYRTLKICENPQKYFSKDKPFRELIIRDAGIGDLLLLEPIIRKLKQTDNREITVASRFPEVYLHNPYIDNLITMSEKNSIDVVKVSDYDYWEDLRSYSETAESRDKKHRTDVFNEKFDIAVEDKEPRLYFEKNEISQLIKEDGFVYIGVQMDASHGYRRFPYGEKLIEYLLNKSRRYKIVLLGDFDYVKIKEHKRIIDLQGKTTKREVISLIRNLDYMIAADSGLMHVALTLHVPTVCIFTIITPDYRLRYYTGQYMVITKKGLTCIGCGDRHMEKCRLGDMKIDPSFIAPCLKIEPEEIYENLVAMKIETDLKINIIDKNEVKKVNINIIPKKTLTMPIIVQNEEKNLPKFIENVINNPYIGRVIAIDGGSNDKTVELLKSAGAEVYFHPYLKTYHEMQAMQRNISFSYVKDGEHCIFMDIDECFSDELKEYLPVLCEAEYRFAEISRRTFDYYADINDISKRIKDYPDWQPRFYIWDRKFKFVGGAHHITLNCPQPEKIQKDIIHFEKEGKARDIIDKQWASMMTGVKQYA